MAQHISIEVSSTTTFCMVVPQTHSCGKGGTNTNTLHNITVAVQLATNSGCSY